MRSDGYVRTMLTLIAAALLALVAIQGGWLGGGSGGGKTEGRWQFMPLRYGPQGNFVVRFDTATGKLERVRFPANDVVWEEIGVVPPGTKIAQDPLRPVGAPQGVLVPPPAPIPVPAAPPTPGAGGAP
jgi:hypothetical protein